EAAQCEEAAARCARESARGQEAAEQGEGAASQRSVRLEVSGLPGRNRISIRIPQRDMDAERWQQIERLYHAALARPATERAAFLAEGCAGDEELRREVTQLLDAPTNAAGVFARPPAALAAPTAGSPDLSVLTGRRLGVYHLQERIGAGGMGEVYRATDTKLNRPVAVKFLSTALADTSAR